MLEPLSTVSRVAVGAVFLAAGFSKTRQIDRVAVGLRSFPIAERLARGHTAATRLARALAGTELTLGALLVVGVATTAIAFVTVGLLGTFTFALALAIRRRKAGGCGCFGRARAASVRWTSIGRNVLLVVLASFGSASASYSLDAAQHGQVLSLYALLVTALLGALAVHRGSTLSTVGHPGESLARMVGSGDGRRHVPAAGEGQAEHDARDESSVPIRELHELELDATRVVLDLDRGTNQGRESPAEEPIRLEAQLVEADENLNAFLSGYYRKLTDEQSPENDVELLRVALIHWGTLLRRRMMAGVHTEVDGLVDHPDCDDDLIGDRLMVDYFESLFDRSHDDDSRPSQVAAVRALARLARQSACLSERQNAWLASDLYWSFVELRGFLRQNGLERLVPYVAQAGAAPLLLFYDVEKYRGLSAPLGRWFTENRDWLVSGTTSGRLPMVWHGLWLYDWRSGHLIGFRAVAEDDDENDVELAAFFDSIVTADNLGRRDCSFAEMVERGSSPHGYLCAGSICHEAAEPHGGTAGRLLRRGAQLWSRVMARGTHGDVGVAVVEDGICGGAGGSGGAGSHGGSGRCGNGLTGLGRTWAAEAVRCLSEQVVRPGGRAMSCVAEGAGLCANPVDRATKELQQAAFGGILVGGRCQISSDAATQEKGPYEVLLDAYAAADRKAEAAITQAWDTYRADTERLVIASEAQRVWNLDRFKNDPETLAKENATLQERRTGSIQYAAEAYNAAVKAAQEQREKDKDAARKEYESKTSGAGRCPPDTPDCGGSDCSAMSAAAMATMVCVEAAQAASELDAFKRQPGWADPSPLEDSSSPAWATCLGSYDQLDPVQRRCWAYDCQGSHVTTRVGGAAAAVVPSLPERRARWAAHAATGIAMTGCRLFRTGAAGALLSRPRAAASAARSRAAGSGCPPSRASPRCGVTVTERRRLAPAYRTASFRISAGPPAVAGAPGCPCDRPAADDPSTAHTACGARASPKSPYLRGDDPAETRPNWT